ncbi:MAG: thiolase family protein [Gammaproteobacteria bacterium]|jgi:acetyl-CoA acetyltransferase|nr:thiolase family protein [Gammaproteobacteria bacterium]
MPNKPIIAGIGHSPFGKLTGRTALDLEVEAAIKALEDSGLRPQDVDGLVTDPGPAQGIVNGITPHYLALGQLLGLDPRYTGSEILGGAGSVAIIQRAVAAIEAGLCSVCLCVYGDAPLSSPGSFAYARGDESAFGLFGAVGIHAFAAQQHMHRWGTTAEQLAEVAIAARAHAAKNPNAYLQEPLTMDSYRQAKYIVEPLKQPDCCLVSDGAAAVLVTAADYAMDLRKPAVSILGHGQAHSFNTWSSANHFDSLPAERCGPEVLHKAGLTPEDIDVLQFYDCFTIVVLMQLEAYGFCKPGEAGPFVEGGRLSPGGGLPVNTSGGLLAEAYGGGMLHVIEAVRQLRSEADERQIRNAETALISGHGLGMNTHTSLILGN